ncbi:MAG: S-methyl-5'-thioadenosine phosphorylase [Chloroflexi bacterium]|nr:S-methyl-5'-thioadenosine phosphorylase [Chloroflexota bacterium]MBK8932902.1 S-methyl-5'-thioadenosine phosphorylase [Chloroflexota bacterium]MBP6803954.1 S-methyl-5'-thioadenosine phosphorylase [Chloroflexota bacterium]MBP7591490.1 S-methyl-5'-thioadenosine phosphorylase [Chloroflexota bacterium]
MSDIELAVIGGSGLYDMPDLTNVEEIEMTTPFGKPSDRLTLGTLHGRRLAFLPRHGRGHVLNPTEVPYRANIFALKTLGVRYIIAVSACGSLREDYAPGHVVVPDQLYDNTRKRDSSFFEGGLVAHVSPAQPFSPELSTALIQAVRASSGTVHTGGAFITIEGPRFSTKAESNTFRQWGMSIIGMTTSPEAFLAAEAEIAYACMAHITDYDVWHESEAPVTVEQVIRVLHHNTDLAQQAIRHLVAHMAEWAGEFAAHSALQHALITDFNHVPDSAKSMLAPIINRYLS